MKKKLKNSQYYVKVFQCTNSITFSTQLYNRVLGLETGRKVTAREKF